MQLTLKSLFVSWFKVSHESTRVLKWTGGIFYCGWASALDKFIPEVIYGAFYPGPYST